MMKTPEGIVKDRRHLLVAWADLFEVACRCENWDEADAMAEAIEITARAMRRAVAGARGG